MSRILRNVALGSAFAIDDKVYHRVVDPRTHSTMKFDREKEKMSVAAVCLNDLHINYVWLPADKEVI